MLRTARNAHLHQYGHRRRADTAGRLRLGADGGRSGELQPAVPVVGDSSSCPDRAHAAHHTPDEYGRRLYVVLSQMRQTRRGRHAHAGIGWIQHEATGRGLFVELHDSDRTRLEHALHVTLEAMRTGRDLTYGSVQTEIASAQCLHRPATCAKTRTARLRGVTIIEFEHAAEALTALERA